MNASGKDHAPSPGAERDTHLVQTYRVRTYECGADGMVQFAQICNYLQETASVHAKMLGLSKANLEVFGVAWVLVRMRVHIDKYPVWGDDVQVLTYPHGMRKLTALRDFTLSLPDGTRVGAASSEWMCIDLATRRSARLPEIVEGCANTVRKPIWPGNAFSRLDYPASPGEQVERSFPVRQSHIDLNGHVNNVRYIEWMMDCTHESQGGSGKISDLEIIFRAETFLGEAVTARSTALNGGGDHAHLVSTAGRDLAVARSSWRNFSSEQ